MVDLRGILINFNLEKLLSSEAVAAGITKINSITLQTSVSNALNPGFIFGTSF